MSEVKFERVDGVILDAKPENSWESRAVFNPGTVREKANIHMLYRAVEGENFSTIGYALLDQNGKVIFRHSRPVIERTLPQEQQGCEDPRIVSFYNTSYIFYTGFDGRRVRVMMAETSDFKTFHKHGQVGANMTDKDAMIFPEYVNGKVAYIHRIEPNVQIALFESMEHFLNPEHGYWREHLENLQKYTVLCHEQDWEAMKIGAGPPPIHIEAGWLLIYHGVDKNFTYRAGVALLDEKNPYRVIARLPYPVMEPETDYEKKGDVNNVVFPEGTALFDDELLIFYGAADKVVGLATVKISCLVEELWKHRIR